MSKKKQPPDTEVPLVQKDGTKQPLTVEGTFAYYFECLCKARAGAYTSLCTADELKTVYETFCFHLKTALLYGFEPAACLVGYMYAHGLGCKKDMFKAALWIEIGAQLDNGIAKDLKNGVDSLKDMDDEHPGLLEMRELVSQARTLFTPEVVRAGAAYAAKVKGLNAGLDPEKTYIPNDFTEKYFLAREAGFVNGCIPPYLSVFDDNPYTTLYPQNMSHPATVAYLQSIGVTVAGDSADHGASSNGASSSSGCPCSLM